MVNKSIRNLLEFLYPAQCLRCGMLSEHARALCEGCERDLPANRHCCDRCALPLDSFSFDQLCGKCTETDPPYSQCIVPWVYEREMGGMIRALKQQGRLAIARLLGELLAEQLSGHYSAGEWPDVVVPMPLHWLRYVRRGFNQSTEMARHLLNNPLFDDLPESYRPRLTPRLCARTRITVDQRTLGARRRGTNLRQAFAAKPTCRGLRIAILDDVVTTGATAGSLSRELLRAGAQEVHLWAIARTPLPSGHKQPRLSA